jgi:hypothetical protein
MHALAGLIMLSQCGAYLCPPALARFKSSSSEFLQVSQVCTLPCRLTSNRRSTGITSKSVSKMSCEVDSLAGCEEKLRRCEEEKTLLQKFQDANPEDKTSLLMEELTKMRERMGINEERWSTALRPLIFNHATSLAVQVSQRIHLLSPKTFFWIG